jgi:hypothetical protein
MVYFRFSFLLLFFFICNCNRDKEPNFVYDFQGIYLYSSPDLSSKIIKRIPFASVVIVKEIREDGWFKITSNGINGYSFSPNLKNTLPELFLYVDSLDGLIIYEKPSEKSKILDTLVHKSRLKILEIDQSEGKNKKLSWALVEGANQFGYARLDYLSNEPKSYFYSIVKPKGQLLRSKPGNNSPILASLPMNLIGEILEKSTELETISNKKGYWFRTDYKGKMGWIFSSYTVTSEDRKYLEDRDYIRNEEWFMRYMDSVVKVEPYYFNEKELINSKKDVFEQGNFEIFYIRYSYADDDCTISNISKIVFRNKITNQSYSIQGLYSEDLIALDKPFQNTIYTRYESCHCCCPDTGNLLYFILEDSIVYIHYKAQNLQANCLYGPIEGVELERENRFSSNGEKVYMNLRLPICEWDPNPEKKEIKPVGFAHNLFAVLRKDKNKILVEKFYDKGVPDIYKDEWENALPNYEVSGKFK